MTKYLWILTLLFFVGCNGYQRGDAVELRDGRTGIVACTLDFDSIVVIVFDDEGKSTKVVVDPLEIQGKLTKVEKEALPEAKIIGFDL